MTNAPKSKTTTERAEATACVCSQAYGRTYTAASSSKNALGQSLGNRPGDRALAIVISIGGLFIGVRQFNAQQRASAVQMLDQQRQATLTAYFDDMSVLVLQNNLTTSKQGAPVRAIAIARTDTALRVLDGVRKGTLIRYLWEAGLITRQHPVVNLLNADLNGAVFAGANLYQVALSPLGLSHANFTAAGLIGADLSGSNLSGADLSGAALTCSYQSGNSRTGVCADLNGAYLTGANLTGANLTGANLTGANLTGAKLTGAKLTGANLTGANLQGARYNSKLIRVKNARGDL